MVDIGKTFLAMFIKPEHIPDSVSALVKLDVTDRSIQKADKDLAVGKYAQPHITKARMDKAQQHWLDNILTNLRAGYVSAATKILQLPLKNKVLRRLSVLDPELHNHSQTTLAFKHLARALPNVVKPEEEGDLAMELNAYSVDRQVQSICDEYGKGKRVDTDFWAHVSQLKTFDEQRYPTLCKLVCSLLTIFSGPLIESTFNIMGDIIEEDRTKLTIENYEAVAIVKSVMKRKKVHAATLKVTASMKRCCISAYSSYQKHLQSKKELLEQKKQEKLNQSVAKLKQEKAKHLAKLVKLKNRLLKKDSVSRKRKITASNDSGNSRQWKRIKQ